jgi:hypothetical protein
MNCETIKTRLDDYLDDALAPRVRSETAAHLAHCKDCSRELAFRRELIDGLRDLPVPPMSPGFRTRAFSQAAGRERRTVNYDFAAGFSGAIAAGLLVWIALMFWQPGFDPAGGPALQVVQLQIETPSEVSLVFHSGEAIPSVDFELNLPAGVMLAGYPGQQQLAWQDGLKKGRNVLKLKLIAEANVDGELVSIIHHEGRQKVFRVPLRTSDTGAGLTSMRSHNALLI